MSHIELATPSVQLSSELEADARALYEFVQERAFHGGGKDWDQRSDEAKQDWRDAVHRLDEARSLRAQSTKAG